MRTDKTTGPETMSWDEYRSLDAVNFSSLLHIARSPAHYQHALAAGSKDTAALSFGRLAHLAILEPERYAAETAIWTGGRRAGKEWTAWQAEHLGRIHVSADDHALCTAMALSVAAHPIAGAYLAQAARALIEHTIKWKHATGVVCKSRLDWADVATHTIVDLKTTRDATEFEFGRSAARYRYHVRAAFYADAYFAKFGAMPTFVLLAVEKEAPHAVACYRIGEDAIEAGRNEYQDLLARLLHCRENDEWPGIGRDVEMELMLPDWAYGASGDLELVVDGESVSI